MTFSILIEFLITAAVSFLVAYISVPLCKKIAYFVGAIDYPGNRRINSSPIPRCGGIALYLGLVAGVLTIFIGARFFDWEMYNLYLVSEVNYIVLFFGVTCMFCVGLVDDITQLNPWVKLAGQVVAAAIVVYSGLSIGTIKILPGQGYVDLEWLDYPLSILYLIVFVNIINLIDGLDGLASGIVAIVSGSLLYLVIMRGNMTLALLTTSLIAVCLAFLRYNVFPASIFMGDSGSMLLGLVVGIISVSGVARMEGIIIMFVPLAIAGVPVLDTFSAIVRRLRGHQSIGQADMNHLHHRLMRAGLGQRRSVVVLWLCTLVLSIVGCVIVQFSGTVRWAIFLSLFVIVFMVIWYFGLFKPVLRHHYDNRGSTGPRVPYKRK